VTNEDTVVALTDTAGVPGATCEIDTWRIADGTMIVWHDSTWNRVADPATLPAGVAPSDLVKNATWAQVSQIRTKGGSPVATLAQMIDASGLRHVPLVVEVRNTVTQPASWVSYANAHAADVRYYRQPGSSCATVVLDQLHAAGAQIGLKVGQSTPCPMTPAQMQAKGVSFITIPVSKVTPAYTKELRGRGIATYASGAVRSNAKAVLSAGAAKLLVDRPRDAATW
jgi:glycerophosphoryl diester phosphodiesterase